MSPTSELGSPGPGARVLVLGVGGQLGRAVVARLAQDGYRVRAFQRRAPAADRDPAVEVVLGTALDRNAVARAAVDEDAMVNVPLVTPCHALSPARMLVSAQERLISQG